MKKKVIIVIIIVIVMGAVLYFFLKPGKVIISFDVDGGSKVSDMEIVEGNKIKLPLVKKEGYDFVGWYINDKKIDDNYIYNEDVVLQAKWEFVVTYKVSFESNGGSNVENIVIREGEKLTLPENPSREDYNFLGWKYESGEFIEDNIIVDKDIVLYAEWEYKYYCDSGYTLKDKKCTKRLEALSKLVYECPVGYSDLGKAMCFKEYRKVPLSEMICPSGSNPVPDMNGRCYVDEINLSFDTEINPGWYFYGGKYYNNFTSVICKNGKSTSMVGDTPEQGYYCDGEILHVDFVLGCPSSYDLVGEMCYKTIEEPAKVR